MAASVRAARPVGTDRAELLSAAELLLSVSPLFRPGKAADGPMRRWKLESEMPLPRKQQQQQARQQQARDRSWSLQSLETLVDVAARADFSIAPSAGTKPNGLSLDSIRAHGPVKGGPAKKAVTLRKKLPVAPEASSGKATAVRSVRLASRPGPTSAAASHPYHQQQQQQQQPTQQQQQPTQQQPRAAVTAAPARYPSVLPTKYKAVYFREGRVGIYTQAQRKQLIQKFMAKRARRTWGKKVRYSCRKNLAQQRVRVKGRFVKIPPNEAAP